MNTAADYEERPQLDDAFFARATVHVNGKPVIGRPPLGEKPITLRLDPDVIDAFQATGAGWQGRMNEALIAAAKQLRSE